MLIGFKAQFAAAVERGEKCQTIRALRKDGRVPKVGERLYLYTGLRTKACRKIGEGIAETVVPIRIQKKRPDDPFPRLVVNRVTLGDWDAEDLATDDGFTGLRELGEWFEKTHGLPFTGTLIRWRHVPQEGWAKP